MLTQVHPGVTIEVIQKEISWELKLAEKIEVTEPPTEQEVRMIRQLDPEGIYIGTGMADLTFERYMDMLSRSLESFH